MTTWARQKAAWLRNWRVRYKAGDKGALLEAVRWCLQMTTRPPNWVTFEIQEALTRFYTYQAATLDEAFGIEKRAQDNRGIVKKRRAGEKMFRVWNLVLLATKEDDDKRAPKNKVSRYEKKLRPDGTRRALDNELFEDIAELLGINS
jgi:hypothetical protein